MPKYGDALVAAMEAAEMTQEKVAELAGVSQETISRIVTGSTAEPKAGTWSKIAAAFGLSGDQLLEGASPAVGNRAAKPVTVGRTDAPALPAGEGPFDDALGHAFDRSRHTMGDVRNVERSLHAIPRMMVDGTDPVALVREWLDAAARLRKAGVPYSDIALAAELTGERKMDAVQRARHEQRIADLNAEGDAELAKLRGEPPPRKKK